MDLIDLQGIQYLADEIEGSINHSMYTTSAQVKVVKGFTSFASQYMGIAMEVAGENIKPALAPDPQFLIFSDDQMKIMNIGFHAASSTNQIKPEMVSFIDKFYKEFTRRGLDKTIAP